MNPIEVPIPTATAPKYNLLGHISPAASKACNGKDFARHVQVIIILDRGSELE